MERDKLASEISSSPEEAHRGSGLASGEEAAPGTSTSKRRIEMMSSALTENETPLVWRKMYEAEVRSLYFAEQAVRYNRIKQLITGTVFFLSSGAAATILSSAPHWIPLTFSAIIALVTAYSISTNLDSRISTLTKLHYKWNQLNADYERLWNRWYESGSERMFQELLKDGREASEMATQLPFNEKALDKWENIVIQRLKEASATT